MDGSLSVKAKNFKKVIVWVNSLTEKFDLSDGSTNVGVIQYGTNKQMKIEIALGSLNNSDKFSVSH